VKQVEINEEIIDYGDILLEAYVKTNEIYAVMFMTMQDQYYHYERLMNEIRSGWRFDD